MFTRLSRYALGVALSAASSGIFASVVFTDSPFNLAGYSTTPTFMTPAVTLTHGQCLSCGNPGTALQIVLNSMTATGGLADVGFVNNAFTYDPGTQGAISSIGAFVDKNLLITVGNTNGFGTGIPFGNNFRPLISQGGLYYLAAIAGPMIPGPTVSGPFSASTGYVTISQTALLAADFTQYDFATNAFGIAHPNFAGGVLSFGIGQISSAGTGFTNNTITAQYDNLRINVNATSVPEPGTLALFGFGLVGVFAMRRRRTA